MLIDRSHRTWMTVTLCLFVLATILYIWYAFSEPGGPRGKTLPGMLFGVAGTLLVLLAGLLSVRKRFSNRPVGKLSTWLRGHIWLGLLSVPLVVFHAGFHWGGALETALLLLFAAIVLSGIAGLALQNYLPRVMQRVLAKEVQYDQISSVCQALCREADDIVTAACGSANETGTILRKFHLESVLPYLQHSRPRASQLYYRSQSQRLFEEVQVSLPSTLHSGLQRLAELCEERRQLTEQARLHHWMHGWLLVHVPLSLALLVLIAIHVIKSLIVY